MHKRESAAARKEGKKEGSIHIQKYYIILCLTQGKFVNSKKAFDPQKKLRI